MQKRNDRTVIIGGGFYGLRIALYLYEKLGQRDIIIIEKEDESMDRASYVNQARVHNGYHYPRSLLTAYRSRVNFPRFVDEYPDSIVSDFDKYYAIAKTLSKVSPSQFLHFCEKIEAEIEPVDEEIKQVFNNRMTAEVFKVKEYAFDARKIRTSLLNRIRKYPSIKLIQGESAKEIVSSSDLLEVVTEKSSYTAKYVLNCTYSNINTLHRKSGIDLVNLKHEITEMCLVRLPNSFENFSVTMMDGPFFSIMPFPSRKLFTLSHVRYTPHESWLDNDDTEPDKIDTHLYLDSLSIESNYQKMYKDVIRFIPGLKDMEHIDSIFEVKTVLVKSEDDDSRPILYRDDFGLRNYICIMGGKVDNIYDVFEELDKTYAKAN